MAQDPQKINVVVSGATSTQVKTPTSDNKITVSQSPTTATVSKTTQESNINVGFLGVQGIPGTMTIAPGEDGSFLYNRVGYVSGSSSFFYYPSGTKLDIMDKDLVLGDGTTFILSGAPLEENAFLLKDVNNKEAFRIDTKNNEIHLNNNVYVGGSIVPNLSGVYNLGSEQKPWKDIYLQGESIYFINEGASIKATSSGFSFQISGQQGTQEILNISTGTVSGILMGDGAQVTGVPYTGLKDAGIYTVQNVASGSENATVEYFSSEDEDTALPYDPSVLCTLYPPSANDNVNKNDFYFTFVRDITRSGCKAEFSSKVSGDGYQLHCHISPRMKHQS